MMIGTAPFLEPFLFLQAFNFLTLSHTQHYMQTNKGHPYIISDVLYLKIHCEYF